MGANLTSPTNPLHAYVWIGQTFAGSPDTRVNYDAQQWILRAAMLDKLVKQGQTGSNGWLLLYCWPVEVFPPRPLTYSLESMVEWAWRIRY